jgi:metacaspase-1
MNDPRDTETNEATDGEGSVSPSQKISSEVTSDEYSGVSLHIGLNRVDPAHYDGWDGALNACEFDANDMETLAKSRGFEVSKLLTDEATADAITAVVEDAAARLGPGDIFFVTYSGHGGQVPDKNAEEELDRSDETWLAFDRQIVDDELYALWGKFRPGVRIMVLSDSCHSGSVTRDIDAEVPDPVATRDAAAKESPRYRAMPRDVMIATYRAHAELYDGIQSSTATAPKAEIGATVLLISGCQDDQLSLDGFSNGLFTENLRAVWDDGAWSGSHTAFHEAIRSRMPPRQQPNYTRVGAANDEFEQQDPFMVG